MIALPNLAWRVVAAGAWLAAGALCLAASAAWPEGAAFAVVFVVGGLAGFAVWRPDSSAPTATAAGLAVWWLAAAPGWQATTVGIALLLATGHLAAATASGLPLRGTTEPGALTTIGRGWLVLAGATVLAAAIGAVATLRDPTAPDATFWFAAALVTVAASVALLARRRE